MIVLKMIRGLWPPWITHKNHHHNQMSNNKTIKSLDKPKTIKNYKGAATSVSKINYIHYRHNNNIPTMEKKKTLVDIQSAVFLFSCCTKRLSGVVTHSYASITQLCIIMNETAKTNGTTMSLIQNQHLWHNHKQWFTGQSVKYHMYIIDIWWDLTCVSYKHTWKLDKPVYITCPRPIVTSNDQCTWHNCITLVIYTTHMKLQHEHGTCHNLLYLHLLIQYAQIQEHTRSIFKSIGPHVDIM